MLVLSENIVLNKSILLTIYFEITSPNRLIVSVFLYFFLKIFTEYFSQIKFFCTLNFSFFFFLIFCSNLILINKIDKV